MPMPRRTQPKRKHAILIASVAFFAVLAGVPRGPLTPEEARLERRQHALEMGRQEIEGALDRYRADHGTNPGVILGDSFAHGPDAGLLERQLTYATDRAGEIAPQAETGFPFGPYLPSGLPVNPIHGRSDVRITDGEAPPDGSSGWSVDIRTGSVSSNALEEAR